MGEIFYSAERVVEADAFVDLLRRSTLAERRPVDDAECVAGMLEHADLMITAWCQDTLVGLARSVTDFNYCCYLSDLAVDADFQHAGIGTELLCETRARLGFRCSLILLSAPAAQAYYPRVGFTRHESAWVLGAEDEIRLSPDT
jgi:ribosomal protein S18 acetylase RimI-like enzyme